MKKIWLGIAALLFGGSLIYGTPFDQSDQGIMVTESYVVPTDSSGGLTPRRAQSAAIQHVPVPVPMPVYQSYEVDPSPVAPITHVAFRAEEIAYYQAPTGNGYQEPASNGVDYAVYAELERISNAIDQLKKDTAKPDPKKSFSAPKVTGRLLFNTYGIDQSEPATHHFQNKAGLRELRMGVVGTGYEVFDYKAEVGLGNEGHVNLVDAWIGAKNMPFLGYLRVGHYLVENGIAYQPGTFNTTATDSLPASNAFCLVRRFGISSEHLFAQDRIRWFYGFFQGTAINVNRALEQDNQGPIFNTRFSIAPRYSAEGRHLTHFGVHYTYVGAQTGVSTKIGGKGWLSDSVLTTGTIASNHHHRTGFELLCQSGPWGVMSDVYIVRYGAADKDRLAKGVSVECWYFLTGEHRAYNLATATMGVPKVNRPFEPFKSGGWNLIKGPGAWQLFTQYSYIDLNDWRGAGGAPQMKDDPVGGVQHDWTVGMHWFWTSNLRCIFEYTRSQQNLVKEGTYYEQQQNIFGASIRVMW